MTDLYLVRHFAVDADVRLCYGSSDIALADGWRAATEELQCALETFGVYEGAVYSSPLTRCRVIADALVAGKAGKYALIFDDRLREFDFGQWEGCLWDDIPRSEIDAWAADLSGYRVPGGDCLRDVYDWCDAFMRDAMNTQFDRAVVVAHSGVLKCLVGRALSMEVKELFRLQFDFGSISHIVSSANSIKVGFVNRVNSLSSDKRRPG